MPKQYKKDKLMLVIVITNISKCFFCKKSVILIFGYGIAFYYILKKELMISIGGIRWKEMQ